MSKMIVDGGQPFGQQAHNACEETLTFNVNPNSPVCLPLVSESGKLIWVHSHQIDLQMDGATEMDKAFDRFPYLTQKETEALAQRCSLHPDQVKVWFMAQRLRHGISWDYKDIIEIRRKYLSGQINAQRKAAPQNRMDGKIMKGRRNIKKQTSVGIKAGDVRVGKSPTAGENAQANQEELPMKKKNKNLEGDKTNTQKKRKMMMVTDEMGMKRMKECNVEGLLERVLEEEEVNRDPVQRKRKKSTQSYPEVDTSSLIVFRPQTPTLNASPLTDNLTDMLRGVPCSTPNLTPVNGSYTGEEEKQAGLEGEPHEDAHDLNIIVTDIAKLKELIEADKANNPTPHAQQQECIVLEPCTPPTLSRRSKTQAQLTMMKTAFLKCQYPDRKHYSKLAKLIGIPHHMLVQYFADMRYYVKKTKPRWMTHEEHRQTVANIKYRQYRDMLVKAEPSEGGATWMEKL